jgi:hypothetical protein
VPTDRRVATACARSGRDSWLDAREARLSACRAVSAQRRVELWLAEGGCGRRAHASAWTPQVRRALEAAYEFARVSGAPLKQALKEAVGEEVRAQLEEAPGAPDDLNIEAKPVSGNAVALADAARGPGSILLLGLAELRAAAPGAGRIGLPRARKLRPAPLIVHPRGMHEEPTATPTTEAGKVA